MSMDLASCVVYFQSNLFNVSNSLDTEKNMYIFIYVASYIWKMSHITELLKFISYRKEEIKLRKRRVQRLLDKLVS